MLTNEQLHGMAFDVTEDIVKKYPHLLQLWRAVLGGYVLPELAKSEPDSVAGNEGFEAMIKEFSPENIRALMEPKVVEVEKEVTVEVPTVVEKKVLVPTSGEKVTHRRLKDGVVKVRRKKRGLNSAERDMVILLFNDRQDMIDKSSSIFKTMVDKINEGRKNPEDHISALQLTGYWGSLCKWAMNTAEERNRWINRELKRERFSVVPIFTTKFIHIIRENYHKNKVEEESRKRDHAEIKRTGKRGKVIASEKPVEDLPIEELDLSDII
jgi:hypothetical protein